MEKNIDIDEASIDEEIGKPGNDQRIIEFNEDFLVWIDNSSNVTVIKKK